MMRCTGHCCRAFTLPLSPDALAKKVEAQRAPDYTGSRTQDLEQIAAMVIYLGFYERTRSGELFGIRRKEHAPWAEGSHFYTCKNFDAETGNCRTYETRPRMCSGYPYSHECNYADCSEDERGIHIQQGATA